jgi:hypothetical protein
VPEAYKVIEHLARLRHRGPVSISARLTQNIPEYTEYSNDHKDRQAQLRSGKLFRVRKSPHDDNNDKDYRLAYEPFFVLECYDLILSPADAIRYFENIPSLMLERKMDAQRSQFKVYLHGRLPGEQIHKLEQFAKDLKKYREKHGGLRINGRFYSGGGMRYVNSMEDLMSPIELGCGEQDWKLFYWSWKVYNHEQLAGLFHLRHWHTIFKNSLPGIYKSVRASFP